MKKKDSLIPSNSDSLLQAAFSEDNRLVHWLSENGYKLLGIILSVLTFLILLALFFSSREKTSEASFLKADREFTHFATSHANQEEAKQALIALSTILVRHPELQAKYDGLIAQTLIDRGMTQEALPFANRALTRTQTENAPFYSVYAQNTLLIGQSRYDEALLQSRNLQTELENSSQTGKTLKIFNLLRIGMLQEKLNLHADELQTWDQLKKAVSQEDVSSLLAPFQEGKVSLMDYLQAREAFLKNNL